MPLMTLVRRLLIILIVVLGIQVPTNTVSAAPAELSNPPVIDGFVRFSRLAPSYAANDSNGRITGQVTYQSQISIAWSYRLTPAVAGLATGFMHEWADLFCGTTRVGGYHDEHRGIPSSYLVHSSFRDCTRTASTPGRSSNSFELRTAVSQPSLPTSDSSSPLS